MNENNDDLVVGLDGTMNEAGNAVTFPLPEVKQTEASEQPISSGSDAGPSAPAVNDLTPPPDDSAVVTNDVSEVSEENIPQGISTNAPGGTGVVEAPSDDINDDKSTDNFIAPEGTPSQQAQTPPVEKPRVEDSELPMQGISHNSKVKKRPHEHRNNKSAAIVVTIIIALLLAAVAVYVYLSAESNATPVTSSIDLITYN